MPSMALPTLGRREEEEEGGSVTHPGTRETFLRATHATTHVLPTPGKDLPACHVLRGDCVPLALRVWEL